VWRPTAAVAVRAAVGGGFAEAPLGDLIGTNCVPFPNNFSSPTYYTVSLTNLKLQPEKSFAFDLGTDIRLHNSTIVSFDIYRSNLYGQFYNSTMLTGTYLGLPLYTSQYGNLGESRYEGVLLDLRHDVPHGMYWSLSGGLTRGYVVSVPASFYNTAGGICNRATNANCTNQSVVPNINFNGTFAASIPYSQTLGIIGYRWNPEKYIDLVGTYYGNNNTYFRPAFTEFDGNIGYPLTKNISLLVVFRNITGIFDGATQVFSAANLSGAPTISGLPDALYGEDYGPRTVLVTAQLHL
jgi:outer membrane receptor protein involved in Fe transport